MKCTQCGNTSFLKDVDFPFDNSEGARFARTYKIYVCDQCGHVEHFYTGPVEANKEIQQLEMEFKNATAVTKSELNKLSRKQSDMNSKAKHAYNKETEKLEALISDESITVALHKKAKDDLAELKNYKFEQKLKMCGLSLVDYPDRRQIASLQSQINRQEKEHQDNISNIKRKYRN